MAAEDVSQEAGVGDRHSEVSSSADGVAGDVE